MNDELRHANNYKYIKREWKNGKWQYTYEDSKGNSPKKSLVSRSKNILSDKVAKIYRRPTPQQKLGSPRPKKILSDKVADVFKRESVSERLDVAVAKKNSKTAMQRTPSKSVKNDEPKKLPTSAKDVVKQKVADIKTSAKESMAKGVNWIKDKLGYDEKERYEAAAKNKKGDEETYNAFKDVIEKSNAPVRGSVIKTYNESKRRLEESNREVSKAKDSYSKTVIGVIDTVSGAANDIIGRDKKDSYTEAVKKQNKAHNEYKALKEFIDKTPLPGGTLRKAYNESKRRLEESKREVARAKETYSKTVIGAVDSGRDWLEKLFKVK